MPVLQHDMLLDFASERKKDLPSEKRQRADAVDRWPIERHTGNEEFQVGNPLIAVNLQCLNCKERTCFWACNG